MYESLKSEYSYFQCCWWPVSFWGTGSIITCLFPCNSIDTFLSAVFHINFLFLRPCYMSLLHAVRSFCPVSLSFTFLCVRGSQLSWMCFISVTDAAYFDEKNRSSSFQGRAFSGAGVTSRTSWYRLAGPSRSSNGQTQISIRKAVWVVREAYPLSSPLPRAPNHLFDQYTWQHPCQCLGKCCTTCTETEFGPKGPRDKACILHLGTVYPSTFFVILLGLSIWSTERRGWVFRIWEELRGFPQSLGCYRRVLSHALLFIVHIMLLNIR